MNKQLIEYSIEHELYHVSDKEIDMDQIVYDELLLHIQDYIQYYKDLYEQNKEFIKFIQYTIKSIHKINQKDYRLFMLIESKNMYQNQNIILLYALIDQDKRSYFKKLRKKLKSYGLADTTLLTEIMSNENYKIVEQRRSKLIAHHEYKFMKDQGRDYLTFKMCDELMELIFGLYEKIYKLIAKKGKNKIGYSLKIHYLDYTPYEMVKKSFVATYPDVNFDNI